MKMETAQALIDRANERFRKDWHAAGRLGFAALAPLFVGSCAQDCGARATGRVIEGIGCALVFCAFLGAWWSVRALRVAMRGMRSYRTTLYVDGEGDSRVYVRGADEHDLGGAFAAFFALVRTVEIRRLRARMEHYKRACITTSNEVTRVLGEALYGPNPDAWSTHTPEAIADEAAEEIGRLRAENDRLRAQIAIEVGTRDNALSEYRVAECRREEACRDRDRAFADGAMLRAEIQRMRGEIITYQDAHTTGTEIIDELRAKVEALEALVPSNAELVQAQDALSLCDIEGLIVPDAKTWLNRVSAARKGGE